MTPSPETAAALAERRDDAILLADVIVQAWERSDVPFDRPHQIQLALIAAKFVLHVADDGDHLRSAAEGSEG